MASRNKLKEYPARELRAAFNQLSKGKKTVADVAEQFKVHPSTIRYHVQAKTFAKA